METWKRFVFWLSMTGFGTWMTKTISTRIDPVIFRMSGGRFTSIGPAVIPQLILTTKGRKSGQERDAQLVYTDIDGIAHVDASNFGGERHPAWSYNLTAEPEAYIQLKDKKTAVIAELLSDEEKESVWDRLVSNIPNYSAYKERTDRNLKVYRLLPRTN
jgi:deazaflavin-dependent oxidoreductase (nitroreductase family)